jgi:acyl-CoA reductase-like NAD-dependent aldehyde dehydrogenase
MQKPNYSIYCGGKFITTNNVLEIHNPFNQSIVATTYLADQFIVEEAIIKALAVKEELQNIAPQKKHNILKQISNEVYANRKRLAEVLSLESAKPLKYALAEIDRSAYTFAIAAEESKKDNTQHLNLNRINNTDQREGVVNYFPIGLIAGIAPFNFPMNLAVHKLAPAIASGCPIILKPASRTPLSCLELAKIIDRTELPKGSVSILPMDRATGNILVKDERFKLLSFTGSPDIGWKMKAESQKKKIVLELGGNAATIITESADLKDALTKSLMGAFAYSGQICIHAQRFIIHTSLYQKFTDELKELALNLKYGDPLIETTDVSNMIDEENAIRVETWIKEALQQGAQLICGGKRNGNYIEPTILINCNNTMKLYAEEVFGPVICINSYQTIEDAIDQANNTKFGLQCGVFTNNETELNKCFKQIEVGGVIHNNVPTIRYDQMPYGGVKESGLGREGVRYAMLDMLEPKILVK